MKFGYQDRRFGAKSPRNASDEGIMISLALLKHVYKIVSLNVNTFLAGVIRQFVGLFHRRKAAHNLAGIRIQNDELSRVASRDKQAMISFVKLHRHEVLCYLSSRPG